MTNEGMIVAMIATGLITVVYLSIDWYVSWKRKQRTQLHKWLDEIYPRIHRANNVDDLIDLRQEASKMMRDYEHSSIQSTFHEIILMIEKKITETVND